MFVDWKVGWSGVRQGVRADGKWGKWMIREKYADWEVGWSGARG